MEKVKEEIFTGCTTDYQLDFESHISKKINKVTRMFGLLCRSFSCLDIENFHLLMVQTNLDYASYVLHHKKLKT